MRAHDGSLSFLIVVLLNLCVANGSYGTTKLVFINEATIFWGESNSDVCHTLVAVQLEPLDLFSLANFTVMGLHHSMVDPHNASLDATVYTKVLSTRRQRLFDDEVMWYGMIIESGRFGFATLLWHGSNQESGTMVGTFTTEIAAYELDQTMNDGNGKSVFRLRCTFWNNDEQGMESSYVKTRSDNRDSFLPVPGNTNQQGPYSDMTKTFSNIPNHSGSTSISYGPGAALWNDRSNQSLVRIDSTMRKLQTDAIVVVNLLVVVTKRAMCDAAGLARRCAYNKTVAQPIIDKIALAEHQTFVALHALGVTVRVVEIMFLSDNYDPTPNGDSLDFLRKNHVIQQRRNDVNANLVLMIAGTRERGGASGIGAINGAESVVTVDGMSQFTFTHEIGHNFGCRHDRESTDDDHAFAHGLQIPFQFRTVMSYRCDGSADHCPRVPMFSAQGQFLNGVPLGDARHDNARMIRENAARVSQRSSRPTCASAAQAIQCPGQNLMKKRRLFLLCREECFDQAFLWVRRLLGWSCGGCE